MKLRRWSISVLLISILITANVSVYGVDNRIAASVKNLAGNIAQQFSSIELRVAAIQGGQVYLNAGRNKFVREGAVYQIIADNAPLIDPGSKRKLGNLEIRVAEVQVETVRDVYSIAKILDKERGEQSLAVGQRAVARRVKASMAVIPFEYLNSLDKTTPRIAQEIMVNELINSGWFEVAGSVKTDQAVTPLQSDSLGTIQFSKDIGKALGVEYVLYGFIIDFPGFMEIQCRIHSTADGIGIAAATIRIEAKFADKQQ